MRPSQILCLIIAALATQVALAQRGPTSTPSPFGAMQSQIDSLTARIEAIENAAPSSSVEDRSYCMIVNVLVMIGIDVNQTETLQSGLIRRTATFSGGTFTATLLSSTFNSQTDNGVVIPAMGGSPDPLMATYTQTGNKLDMLFPDGSATTWYVSADGSVILSGSTDSIDPAGPATIGLTRTGTFIENDTCDIEGQ